MKSTKSKICIFDFDGVIGNSREVGYAMHNNVREKYGLPPIENQKDFLRVIDNGHIKEFLEATKITDYYLDCNAYYEERLKNVELFPAMKSLLQDASHDIIIISSIPDRFIRTILEQHGIEGVGVYGKETAKTKKERFAIALDERNLSKDDIIYIGDTIDDFHFCEQVGIPMIGSNYGYSDLSEIKDSLLGLKEEPEELVEWIKPHMLVR